MAGYNGVSRYTFRQIMIEALIVLFIIYLILRESINYRGRAEIIAALWRWWED